MQKGLQTGVAAIRIQRIQKLAYRGAPFGNVPVDVEIGGQALPALSR